MCNFCIYVNTLRAEIFKKSERKRNNIIRQTLAETHKIFVISRINDGISSCPLNYDLHRIYSNCFKGKVEGRKNYQNNFFYENFVLSFVGSEGTNQCSLLWSKIQVWTSAVNNESNMKFQNCNMHSILSHLNVTHYSLLFSLSLPLVACDAIYVRFLFFFKFKYSWKL